MAEQSIRRLSQLSESAQGRVWYFCVPTHLNLGDQAQAFYIKAWLTENYPERQIVTIDSVSYNRRRQEHMRLLLKLIRPNDIIVFQSGYTFKDKHIDGNAHIQIVTRFKGNRIIFFPQSIRLDGEKERRAYCRAFAAHRHITLLVRDKTSMERAKAYFPKVRLLLFPDIVTTRIGMSAFFAPRRGILFCLRSDDEQSFSPKEIAELARQIDIGEPVKRTDTASGAFNPAHIQDEIEHAIKQYAAYMLIVTDRYHGTIFALAAGTPVVVLSTTDHKVVEGAEWLADIYPDQIRIARTPEEARSTALELLANDLPAPAEPYFKKRYYDGLKALLEADTPFEICAAERCTGCMLCAQVCAQGAISRATDERGFNVPRIQPQLCTRCGNCVQSCPVGSPPPTSLTALNAGACWTQDTQVRRRSSSGGAFFGLADAVLRENGYVCGAAFDEGFVLRHVIIRSKEELPRLMGSKYVQSDMSGVYAQIKPLLESGKPILFAGTPCQVAAIKRFAKGADENLRTVDLVCHGVPSPMMFAEYLRTVSDGKPPIKEICFRHKEPSWRVFSMRICFEDGSVYQRDAQHDPYLVSFLNDYTLRESCHTCPYAGARREGDITLGDFWNYVSADCETKNTQEGISAVLVNSDKGLKMLKGLREDGYTFVSSSLCEVMDIGGPLTMPTAPNAQTAECWETYHSGGGFAGCAERYFYPRRISARYRLGCWVNDHSYRLPKGARRFYERMRDGVKRL